MVSASSKIIVVEHTNNGSVAFIGLGRKLEASDLDERVVRVAPCTNGSSNYCDWSMVPRPSDQEGRVVKVITPTEVTVFEPGLLVGEQGTLMTFPNDSNWLTGSEFNEFVKNKLDDVLKNAERGTYIDWPKDAEEASQVSYSGLEKHPGFHGWYLHPLLQLPTQQAL